MFKTCFINILSLLFACNGKIGFCISQEIPKFGILMSNLTVTLGREAVITCVVENLSNYKVAWLRVDTQTILTIQTYVITKNHRISVSNNHQQVWKLHIREVRTTDRGWYMCQINTDPMKSQTAYLEVVAPPDILDYATSSDIVVTEGDNVTLRCEATGFPLPMVTWRREDGTDMNLNQTSNKVSQIRNSDLDFTRITYKHSGAYLCIASNGVPPTVSKRITLIVQYPPKLNIQNSLLGTNEGKSLTLECQIEAYPKPTYYWMLNNGELITDGGNYDETFLSNFMYKVKMKLVILDITQSDFGTYTCISKNALGISEGAIKVYRADTVDYEVTQWLTEKNKGMSVFSNGILAYVAIIFSRLEGIFI